MQLGANSTWKISRNVGLAIEEHRKGTKPESTVDSNTNSATLNERSGVKLTVWGDRESPPSLPLLSQDQNNIDNSSEETDDTHATLKGDSPKKDDLTPEVAFATESSTGFTLLGEGDSKMNHGDTPIRHEGDSERDSETNSEGAGTYLIERDSFDFCLSPQVVDEVGIAVGTGVVRSLCECTLDQICVHCSFI
jgi:hypothetical protein